MDADRYDEILCQMPNDRTLVQGIYSAGEILLMINTGHHSRVTRITGLQFFSGQFTKKGQYLSLEDFKGNFIINKVIPLFSFLFFNLNISFVCDVDVAGQTFFLFFSLLAFNYPLSDINCQFVIKFHNFSKI